MAMGPSDWPSCAPRLANPRVLLAARPCLWESRLRPAEAGASRSPAGHREGSRAARGRCRRLGLARVAPDDSPLMRTPFGVTLVWSWYAQGAGTRLPTEREP